MITAIYERYSCQYYFKVCDIRAMQYLVYENMSCIIFILGAGGYMKVLRTMYSFRMSF